MNDVTTLAHRPFGSRSLRSTRRRLALEALERRDVPAVFSPLPSTPDGTPGSLRDAIIQANTNGQDDVINLQAGTYQLTVANVGGQENAAKTGDLDLAEAGHMITIQGAGQGKTIIDGGGLDRVFQVLGNVTAVLRDMTVRNGLATDDGTPGVPIVVPDAKGGAILNAGSLTLDGVAVEGSQTRGTPGPDGAAGQDGGTGRAAFGGGIANVGTLTLMRSVVRNNIVSGGRGGNGAPGTIFTRFTGGTGGEAQGGGIWSASTAVLTISQSTLDDNKALGGFGGSGGDNALSVGGIGGSGGNAEGGGLFLGMGSGLVVNSTISDNTASGGPAAQGGSGGNPAGNPLNPGANGGAGGDGGTGAGGGIAASAPLTLRQATIADNSASGGFAGLGGVPGIGTPLGMQGPDGLSGFGFGGGLTATPGTTLISEGTLIGENTADTTRTDVLATFTSASFTLLQSGIGASGITDGTNGNIVGKAPLLGPLRDNGGPTPTRLPQAGSPAIDAGPTTSDLPADQRGFTPRVVGKAADIGAVEVGASAPSDINSGGGGTTTTGGITVQVVVIKGVRQIIVFDALTGAKKFSVFPFGKRFRGKIQVQVRDVNGDGVADVIVRHAPFKGRRNIRVFSGRDGSALSSKLV